MLFQENSKLDFHLLIYLCPMPKYTVYQAALSFVEGNKAIISA